MTGSGSNSWEVAYHIIYSTGKLGSSAVDMLLQGENLYPSPLIRESVESTSPNRFLPPVRSRERTMMMVDEYEEVFRDAQKKDAYTRLKVRCHDLKARAAA
jgi:hypothetical protein